MPGLDQHLVATVPFLNCILLLVRHICLESPQAAWFTIQSQFCTPVYCKNRSLTEIVYCLFRNLEWSHLRQCMNSAWEAVRTFWILWQSQDLGLDTSTSCWPGLPCQGLLVPHHRRSQKTVWRCITCSTYLYRVVEWKSCSTGHLVKCWFFNLCYVKMSHVVCLA